ncbi:sodium transporter HKT1-like protein [Tanacetum coccineum]|uniref:Sodium transporter HKT1-like protein n=1 Tax=Tanacetum coccineum TaxID=301880 RepID=A0ABQ5IS58_9ASTR
MKVFSNISKKLEQLCSCSCLCRFTWFRLRGNQFALELFYFLLISSIGFFVLQSLDGRTTTFTPRSLDLFFTSVSAATVSSMSTVEMEVFSNDQLVILTILMFIGGEVFTSMVALYIRKFFLKVSPKEGNKVDPSMSYLKPHSNFMNKTELAILECGSNAKSEVFSCETVSTTDVNMEDLKFKSFKFLGLVVLFYLVFVQFLGVVSVLIYINVISSGKKILRRKGLHTLTFSIFTVVSTFANCGFVPTNENMLPFRKNTGLLLILIPQVLLGNTLYPPALRFSIWAIGKFTKKRETVYLLENSRVLGYHQLLPSLHSSLLTITVLGFIMVQFILFSSMEWSSGSLSDMNVYQKLVGILFQTVNTRHTGESIVDLSTISAAVLVLFVVMMLVTLYPS